MTLLLLFILLIVLALLMPIFVRIELNVSVLTLSGMINISIMKISIYKAKFKLAGNRIIITTKRKTQSQKLDSKNTEIVFMKKLISMLYFRQHITDFEVNGQFGCKDNAMTTAMISSSFLAISTVVLCKLKNNKQDANIHIRSVPKYDKDVFSFQLMSKFNMSIFDILFTYVITKLRMIGVNNERRKNRRSKSAISN